MFVFHNDNHRSRSPHCEDVTVSTMESRDDEGSELTLHDILRRKDGDLLVSPEQSLLDLLLDPTVPDGSFLSEGGALALSDTFVHCGRNEEYREE